MRKASLAFAPCCDDVDALAVGHAEPADVRGQRLSLAPNYVQQGTNIGDFINIMGTKVGRVAIFGIRCSNGLRQHRPVRPTYTYRPTRPYYYSSPTLYRDGARSLPPAAQARLDPMITGFNPADMRRRRSCVGS
jgi:hypothetical protein